MNTVVVADDNKKMVQLVTAIIETRENYKVVGTAENGKEALALVQDLKPDLLILDIMMPLLDGLETLEILNEQQKTRPRILCISNMGADGVTSRALEKGADYYIVKPFSERSVLNGIDIVMNRKQLGKPQKQANLQQFVTQLIREIGIPAKLKGYQYIRDALILCNEQPGYLDNITKSLYPYLAEKYKSTTIGVERAIRNAIEIAWEKGDIKRLDDMFGYTVNELKGRPTNSEFIALMSDYIQLSLHEL